MTLHNLIRRAIWIVPLLVCTMWLLASASASSDDGDDGPKFGPWSAPINLGPPVILSLLITSHLSPRTNSPCTSLFWKVPRRIHRTTSGFQNAAPNPTTGDGTKD